MLDAQRLKKATQGVVAAALLGCGWEDALTRFSAAAGAAGAVFMCNRGAQMLAALTTPEVAAAVAEFAAGRAPPNSRYMRVHSGLDFGFRLDQDDYSGEQLASDPFYQEFLRPIGFFWHANLVLSAGRDEAIEISLKRTLAAGPYEEGDRLALNRVSDDLRVAAWLARQTLDAETRGMLRLAGPHGGPVFELDRYGGVLAAHDQDDAAPLRPVAGRLCAGDPACQPKVDRALATALRDPGETAIAALGTAQGRRFFLHVLPAHSGARIVFPVAAAIAVVIAADEAASRRPPGMAAIRELFSFTDRETDIAGLVAGGHDIAEISRRLRIQPGTARTHLKAVFEKSGVSRQAELAALISRLSL